MAEFTIEVTGVDSSLKALEAAIKAKLKQADKGVERAGLAYQHDVQSFPPPIDTGQYRGSMRTMPVEHDFNGNPFVRIGSPAPQSCRLEFGFDNKRDRLGRLYHQKAQPHWLPVMRQNRSKYEEIIVRALS